MRRVGLKIGDMVCVSWEDAVSYPRVECEASDVPLPEFETFGIVAHIEKGKLVLLHERERRDLLEEGAAKKRCIEPTALPTGMIRKISVYRVAGEARRLP
jgi:hypothetical protein